MMETYDMVDSIWVEIKKMQKRIDELESGIEDLDEVCCKHEKKISELEDSTCSIKSDIEDIQSEIG